MKLEEQVCSLELAKKLRELGVKQESLFYWMLNKAGVEDNKLLYFKETSSWLRSKEIKSSGVIEYISAFTVAELGEMLPLSIDKYCLYSCRRSDGLWSYWYQNGFNDEVLGKNIWDSSFIGMSLSEADARAKMLVYLLENKLVSLTTSEEGVKE